MLTRITALFVLSSFIICFAHCIAQAFLFTLDATASDFTSGVLAAASVPSNREFAWLMHNGSELVLQICSGIPGERKGGADPCVVVFHTDDSAQQGTTLASLKLRKRKRQDDGRTGTSGYLCASSSLVAVVV